MNGKNAKRVTLIMLGIVILIPIYFVVYACHTTLDIFVHLIISLVILAAIYQAYNTSEKFFDELVKINVNRSDKTKELVKKYGLKYPFKWIYK